MKTWGRGRTELVSKLHHFLNISQELCLTPWEELLSVLWKKTGELLTLAIKPFSQKTFLSHLQGPISTAPTTLIQQTAIFYCNTQRIQQSRSEFLFALRPPHTTLGPCFRLLSHLLSRRESYHNAM